ncbi:MAG TPA: tetratricopeptide repeat protein [Paracoccaceae bacterium]|nr:tetratricopeptide repeat protein [Paracoccaceae bacterium]HMO70063.1 tetratricopeptide repeat protein [Paracoccaceae bacterium]
MRPVLFLPALLAATLLLAGCESGAERAERHYRSALALLETGDADRALVELRNVLKLDPLHHEARLSYARIQRQRGAVGDAYAQYLSLAEFDPAMTEAQLAVAEMAVEAGSWEVAERHGRAARDLAPGDPAVRLVNAALDYRTAALARDAAGVAAAAAAARDHLARDPAAALAWRLVLDSMVAAGDLRGALPEAEAALAALPDRQEFHLMRLRILAGLGETAALGPALQAMAARFPADLQARQMLIAWFLDQGDLDGAETFLRRLAAEEGDSGAQLAVVAFLRQMRGTGAAEAELDRLIAAPVAEADRRLYRTMRAALVFDDGRQAAAIAEMEEMLRDAVPSEQTRDMQVALARMLETTGNPVGARALVETVLAEDAGHVEALKLRAQRQIGEDRPSDAVVTLRAALAQAPRDADIMTLLGQAHEREGSRELAGERYALAVEVSGRAPRESLRYARFLLAEGRRDAAEAVLADALRLAGGNVELLATMAEVQLQKRDWDRVTRLVWQLRALDSAPARAAADAIEAERLIRQERVEDTLGFLQGLVERGDAGTAAVARMVQIQVRDGRIAEARSLVETQLAAAPGDAVLRFLRAGLHLIEGEGAEAEAIYRAILDETPAAEPPLRALYGLLVTQGRDAEAGALLDSVAAAAPAAVMPRLMQAGRLERLGDVEAAIAVYEALYATDSANPVVANNLASLISTHRADAGSLERAHAIARRLRGLEVPAFQDTYGWIAYRRGDLREALAHLEPAARGLPDNALVQFHLGMTYLALEREAEARATLERAVEIAGDSPLPQFAEARAVLERLGGE